MKFSGRVPAVCVALAGALVVSATSALGADLPYRKAPPAPPPAPVFTWTGFYVGAEGGFLFSDNKWTTTALAPAALPGVIAVDPTTANAKFNETLGRFGGFAGYNYQFNSMFVGGIEGDIAGDFFGDKKSVGIIPGVPATTYVAPSGDSLSADLTFDASLRARLGYLVMPTFMVYGTGGVAFQGTKYSINCPGKTATTDSWCGTPSAPNPEDVVVGYTVGAGVEALIWNNWLARVEYRYSDFGNHTVDALAGTIDEIVAKTRVSTNTVTFGIGYKF